MGRTSTVVLWLLTRGVVLWLFFGREAWVTGDIAYFADSLAHLTERGLGATLVEYPLPGVALVALPWLLAEWLGHPDLYTELVLALAMATDAAFTVLLHRSAARGRRDAVLLWLLAVPFLGATTYARFDLVPGVLAGAALLLLVTHPRAAAVAGVIATGLKLWPALLLPALSARSQERRQVLVVTALAGSGLAVAGLVLAGWARLVSPLTWQADRGLQIESVAATPAMLGWGLGPGGFTVAYSDYNAFEVTGPGVPVTLTVTSALAVLTAVGLGALWVRAWLAGGSLPPDAVAWLFLAAVSAFMVTSRVLSPQYLLWLLPITAAALAVATTQRCRLRLRRWAVLLLVTTAVTHLVFPVYYGHLTQHDPDSFGVVLLLAGRNVMLLWLAVSAALEAWRWTASHRGRPVTTPAPSGAGQTTRISVPVPSRRGSPQRWPGERQRVRQPPRPRRRP
jgi:hypothetical protein